jgi:hypothetical protein
MLIYSSKIAYGKINLYISKKLDLSGRQAKRTINNNKN